MKILILFFLVSIAIPTTSIAQQTDENTLAINNYFLGSNNKTTNTNPSILDTNIKSYAKIIQTGYKNNTYINTLQAGDQQIVNQQGNKNTYGFYNYYSQGNSNLIINQQGNQNSLQIFGENSLMKDAIINQKSSFKSIVVKNYTN